MSRVKFGCALGDNASRMTILFGHPTGSPFSHNAALAHLEAGWLEAFCVPWMPTTLELAVLGRVAGLEQRVARLRRRHFAPLDHADKVQGRVGEWVRLCKRLIGGRWADESLSYEANDWLMNVMRDQCRRPAVTAVHSYEDCSLLQFREAAKVGKSRIYDLPIGYYPAWQSTIRALARSYPDWIAEGDAGESRYVRPEQKREEMELAQLVLAPGSFVRRTVEDFADREVAIAPFGVDADFWCPGTGREQIGPMRFLYAGACSLRKGIPLLMEAWRAASLTNAVLELVGSWRLTRNNRLPEGVTLREAVSPEELRNCYRAAEILVFPSYFEGFGLVILEAMACGLPVITTDATAGPDLLDENTGRVLPAGNLDALVESLRWAHGQRDEVRRMRIAAREKAESMTWLHYRECVRNCVAPLVGGP